MRGGSARGGGRWIEVVAPHCGRESPPAELASTSLNPHLCLKPLSQEIEAASARTSLQGVSERRRHQQGGAREA